MRIVRAAAIALLIMGVTLSVTACGEEVAARVNGEVITKAQWEARYEGLKSAGNFDFEGVQGEATMIELKQRALNELIDEALIRQEAARRGIAASDDEARRALDGAKSGFENDEQFNEALRMQGVDPEKALDYFRDRLTKERLIASLSVETSVTAEEIATYYEQNKQMFKQELQLIVAHILFDENDMKTAEKVLGLIQNGEDFSGMARQYSLDEATRDNGGQISTQLPFTPEIHSAALTLKPGEVYPKVVKDGQGLHIVKLVDRIEEHMKTLEESEEQIRTLIAQERGRDTYYTLIQDLREQADIEIVLQELKVPGAQSGG